MQQLSVDLRDDAGLDADQPGNDRPDPVGQWRHFKAGGAVINAGSIDGSNGIWIEGGTGGSVDNQIGGTIHGKFGAIVIDNVPGMVTNAGSITADGQAVALNDGGILTNLADGLIEGHGESNAVAVILGTSREVDQQRDHPEQRHRFRDRHIAPERRAHERCDGKNSRCV